MKAVPILNLLVLLFLSAFSLNAWADPNDDLLKAFQKKDFQEASRIFSEHEETIKPDYEGLIEGVAASVLWAAAASKQWQIVTRMLQLNPRANVDAAPAEGINRGITVLWLAALNQQWPLVTRMLELNPRANVDTALAEGKARGITVLWLAAFKAQWPLVTRMLELNPKANVDATTLEGINRGATVLWYAAAKQQWPLVTRMLELNPKANIDATPAEGINRGATVLWLAAHNAKWPLVMRMLLLNPDANASTAPAEGGRSVLRYVREVGPAPLKKLLVIREMNRDVQGEDLASRLNPVHLELTATVESLVMMFRKATVAFTNMIDDSGTQEESDFDKLPNELKEFFVLGYLREQDPDLVELPDRMLMALVSRFHKVYKDVDYQGRSVEVVAARVLARLAPPIKDRKTRNKIKTILQVRGWIIEEITLMMKTNVLPARLDQDLRDQLTAALSSKPLNAMTSNWIRETIAKSAGQRRAEEAPEKPNIKKRERGQEGDEPHEEESAPKAQVPDPS